MPGCSIRALWILDNHDAIVFSRRFPVVEKLWRLACQRENGFSNEESSGFEVSHLVSTDSEVATAFAERKKRLVAGRRVSSINLIGI